jgi:thioredoxin reductase
MQVTHGSTLNQEPETYDVVVVGGGAAGLGGALMLGRSRRSVLVIDAGEPRNAPASGVHGFLTRDGMDPAAVRDGRVASAESDGSSGKGGFTVTLEDGGRAGARRLLVATGLIDELPDVAGVRERWGRDVLHCPYCHGWEVRDMKIGVLGSGPMAMHQALLFRQLSADVVLFQHTSPTPSEEEAEQLAARSIGLVEGEVSALEVRDDRLVGVRLRSGEFVPREAVAVAPRFAARAGMLTGLGLETTDHPSGMGGHIEADATGLTAVPGVWVAGNITDPKAQVLGSANAGAVAGAAINADLVAEDTRDAVTAHRERLSTPAGAGR